MPPMNSPRRFQLIVQMRIIALTFCFMQVNLDGLTGPVQFNEYGNRKGINLEILNLQNNSFIKVSRWVVSAISYSLFGYRIVNQGFDGLCATHKRNPFNDG